MELFLLQELQELEEEEVKKRLKQEEQMMKEANARNSKGSALVNRADSVKNTERKKK